MAAKVWYAVESLQALTTVLSQKAARNQELVETLARFCEVDRPHDPSAIADMNTNIHVVRGAFSVSLEEAHDII